MLESPVIQSRGFRNVGDGVKLTGFQVAVRLDYYRGVWASQLRPVTVTVDGESYENDRITWTIAGKTVAQDELAERTEVHWNSMDPAYLTISKAGGLEPGIHEIELLIQFSASYLPPRIDLMFGKPATRRMVLVR
jgi:hypothetical protein